MVDEGRVNILQNALEAGHILGLFGQERIQRALGFTCRVDAAFNPLPGQKLVRTKARRDHPDRAQHRRGIDPDVIRRNRQPVATRGRHILDKGMNRDFLFLRQPPDARRDERGLHRRTAGGIDHQRHRHRLAAREGLVDHRPDGLVAQRGAGPRADHARKAYDRDGGPAVEERDQMFHAARCRVQGHHKQGGPCI